MPSASFRILLPLPAQGAAESEATIVEWHVAPGDAFVKGQVLAQIDSAKSVFDFEAPCDGAVLQVFHEAGAVVSYDEAVVEIETTDPEMRDWIPPVGASGGVEESALQTETVAAPVPVSGVSACSIIGLGAYLPSRVVTNAELVVGFPDITEEYVERVTGVLERHWVADGEKPSDLAYAASCEAIRNAGIEANEIDAIILATWTPDMATPSTACILQRRLGIGPVPSFDLNAACSGWLYGLSMARAMIVSGMARKVLVVGVDVQSQILDRSDHTTCFLFGDGAGAAIVSAGDGGHEVRHALIGADSSGLQLARREEPGYAVLNGTDGIDPWIRMDGQALFRFAAGAFASLIRDSAAASGWDLDDVRWVVPHQANARILKAAAKRCGVPFERVYVNVDHVGNTSSASIPVALTEMQDRLERGDKLILCSVGAGITTGVVTVEW